MNVSASKLIRRNIRETREWLAERPPSLEQLMAFLDEDLGQATFPGLMAATATLGVLGTYYGRVGVIGVIDGQRSGWVEIARAVAYHSWCLKIRAQGFFKAQIFRPGKVVLNLSNFTNTAACLYSYYVTIGDEPGQNCAIETLRAIATVPGAVDQAYWEERVFEPFVLRLRQKQGGFDIPASLEQRNLGPYSNVLAHWNGQDGLAEAIFEACDYHCRNMDHCEDDWDPEFIEPPFDLLPCEILAIYAIRRRLGLPTPEVEHPLLATPLSTIEAGPSSEVDDVLSRVQGVYNGVFAET